jgi:predicted membrane channel-forming protein YqfA (hemolysin III family)
MLVNLLTHMTEVVTICSVLHAVLPPWEALNDFPTAQKYYKLFVYLVGYIALNWRSTLWQSLSTADGSKTSKAANGFVKPLEEGK